MREIKFRAWDKIEKTMASVTAMTFDSPEYNPSVDLNYRLYLGFDDTQAIAESVELSEVELMQYTSLKDKKGREIYENDIVKTKIGVMDFVLKVVFENGKFIAIGDDDDLTAFDLFTIADKCEVIGNIYENSELLK